MFRNKNRKFFKCDTESRMIVQTHISFRIHAIYTLVRCLIVFLVRLRVDIPCGKMQQLYHKWTSINQPMNSWSQSATNKIWIQSIEIKVSLRIFMRRFFFKIIKPFFVFKSSDFFNRLGWKGDTRGGVRSIGLTFDIILFPDAIT